MYFIFYKTSDVFIGEELLQNNGIECEIVPTPVQDKAYCGVCLKTYSGKEIVSEMLKELEYKIYDESEVK